MKYYAINSTNFGKQIPLMMPETIIAQEHVVNESTLELAFIYYFLHYSANLTNSFPDKFSLLIQLSISSDKSSMVAFSSLTNLKN